MWRPAGLDARDEGHYQQANGRQGVDAHEHCPLPQFAAVGKPAHRAGQAREQELDNGQDNYENAHHRFPLPSRVKAPANLPVADAARNLPGNSQTVRLAHTRTNPKLPLMASTWRWNWASSSTGSSWPRSMRGRMSTQEVQPPYSLR